MDAALLFPEISAFEAYLTGTRNASPHTVRGYLSDLAQYAEYLVSRRLTLLGADHLAVRGFLATLHEETAATTRGRKLASLRALYAFLYKRGAVKQNPARLVTSPRKPK